VVRLISASAGMARPIAAPPGVAARRALRRCAGLFDETDDGSRFPRRRRPGCMRRYARSRGEGARRARAGQILGATQAAIRAAQILDGRQVGRLQQRQRCQELRRRESP